MSKYGKGLNYEIASAVKQGLITQPFNVYDVKKHVESRNWTIPDTYLNVYLVNGASESHSQTYKKYFTAIGDGKYIIKED